MDNSENYLINMRDGRLILFTKQANRQVDYHPISAEVAHAIDDGRISWQDVVNRIKANLLNNQDAWDDLLKRKTTMNVRKSTITPEDAEGIETAASAEDMQGAFDMPEIAVEPSAPVASAKAKKSSKKNAEPAVAAAESDAVSAESTAERLTI